jgi:NADH-quinone oxidoreductase subunit L
VLSVAAVHNTLGHIDFHGAFAFMLHGFLGLPTYLALGGLVLTWFIYTRRPSIAMDLQTRFDWLHYILDRKYGFDEFNQLVFAGGSKLLGRLFWNVGDKFAIDGVAVNGSAHSVGWLASVVRVVQTGYLYHYAFAIIIGLLGLLTWFVVR